MILMMMMMVVVVVKKLFQAITFYGGCEMYQK